jgi:hypothetical protein
MGVLVLDMHDEARDYNTWLSLFSQTITFERFQLSSMCTRSSPVHINGPAGDSACRSNNTMPMAHLSLPMLYIGRSLRGRPGACSSFMYSYSIDGLLGGTSESAAAARVPVR